MKKISIFALILCALSVVYGWMAAEKQAQHSHTGIVVPKQAAVVPTTLPEDLFVVHPQPYNPTQGGKLIALSFDDGFNRIQTPKILALVERYGTPFTWFLVGQTINETTRAYGRRAVQMGCELECHTWSHPQMPKLTTEQRRWQIERANRAIASISGRTPIYYRPPYLACNDAVLRDIDMPAIYGSGSHDWKTDETPEMIAQTVLSTAEDGAIFIMHDFVGNARTPEALEVIVPELLKRGYRFVTIEQLFRERGIEPEPHKKYAGPYPPKKSR